MPQPTASTVREAGASDAVVRGGAYDRVDTGALRTSIAVVLMALVVLAGWHLHIQAAVQVFDGLVSMQYNTALCFLALGLAGIGVSLGNRWAITAGGLFVAAMGSAVIVEYTTGHSLGVDTFFFYPWIQALSADPGRMALTTAASFAITGLALVVIAIRPRAYAMFGILNSIPLSLALTSLVGYALGVTYVLPFSLGSQMALHTSVGFLAYGIAMLHHAWMRADRGDDGLPRWCAGIGVALLPVMLVGVAALFSEQSWRIVPVEIVFAVAGVSLIMFAIRGLTTARVAYKGLMIIALPLVLLLTFVALVVRVKDQSESAQTLSLHSTQVVATSQLLLAQIVEAESAVRESVIADGSPTVSSEEDARRLVIGTAAHLSELVADNPSQHALALKIGERAAQRMQILVDVVAFINTGDTPNAGTLAKSVQGNQLMTGIRDDAARFLQEELRLGADRRRLLETSWQRLSWLLVAGTAAAILLSGILALLFGGGISRRLRQLRDNASRFAKGQALAPMLKGGDEIAELDRVFHDMATSLDEVTRREKATRALEGQIVDVRHTEALLQAGALQSAIFNSANFSSIATDAKGVIQIFNVGAERMLGYTAAEVVDKVTPADISEPQELIARARALSIELGTPITPGFEALVFKASRGIEDIYELTYFRKDGSRFPAIVSVTALRDAQENIIGYLLIGTDNTARKQAEEALLQAGALQSAIFNSANFSSIATDARGVIQIFNVGAERMLGYAATDVVDQITPADISDPQELIIRAEALSKEIGTTITPGFEALVFKASRGIEDIYELTYFRKDGSRFPAIVSVTALRDAQENIIGYLLIGTDNTARKEVEAAQSLLDQRLRDQQFYTRSLIESNVDALMTTDPLGIVSDVNQQMITLTGRTREELVGAPFKSFFTDPARADEGIKRALAESKVSNYELTVRTKSGAETVVSYNVAIFRDRDQKLQGVFAAARDVTELKRIERTLQEKNVELEHANRMKSEFLATMSHELRTPLNAIIGFSEALKDGIVGQMTETQSEYIGDIFDSGQHLLALINDILDLSKVEAGMMALELEAVDMKSLLAGSLSIVREKATAQRISLALETDDDLGMLELDMRKTKQIIYNLLSNAVKFSASGGRVEVRARVVPREAVGTFSGTWPTYCFPLADNDYPKFVEISVRDRGIGISGKNMAKLFQAFSQIDSSLARKFEGTGLGLAMVKQLAELHGGTVAVASEEGAGACFSAWLPVRRVGPITLVPGLSVAHPADGMVETKERIALVVEDDDLASDLIRLLLEAEGFIVLRAPNAEQALAMASRQALSLITLDIQLPGMSGWDFLARIRDITSLCDVPVVIISASPDADVARAVGAPCVLQKPVSRGQLKSALSGLGLHAAQGPTFTVLVVDDDPKAVEVIAAFLHGPGFTVVRSYGGIEAIALAQRLRPDLILLDLFMPDVNGFDVAHALRGQAATAAIPILVVTSKHVSEDDRRMLNDGDGKGIGIVPKAGFNRAGFVAEVRRALQPSRGSP